MNDAIDVRPVTALLFMKLESERVPRKNLRPVGGRPLFHYVFDALCRARFVDRIVLNTDSDEIAAAVLAHCDVTIHMRPEHLLAIDRNEANQILAYDLDLLDGDCFLQTHSTNPLLSPDTIDRAVEAFFRQALPQGHDSLFTVTAHRKRFFHCDGRPVNHDPADLRKTQELDPLLEENSCVYIFSREGFRDAGMNRIGRRPLLLPIPAEEALDIDTESDLALADALLSPRE